MQYVGAFHLGSFSKLVFWPWSLETYPIILFRQTMYAWLFNSHSTLSNMSTKRKWKSKSPKNTKVKGFTSRSSNCSSLTNGRNARPKLRRQPTAKNYITWLPETLTTWCRFKWLAVAVSIPAVHSVHCKARHLFRMEWRLWFSMCKWVDLVPAHLNCVLLI